MKLITVLTEKPTGLNGLSETHTVCVVNPFYVAQLLPLPEGSHLSEGTKICFSCGLVSMSETLDVLTDIQTTRDIIEDALNSPDTVQGERTFSPQLRLRTS